MAVPMASLQGANGEAVQRIASLVAGAGGRAYLVGGAVRDLVTGSVPKDLDLEVFGIPPDSLVALVSKEFPLDLVGASFGVLKVKGHDIDISLPRRESKSGRGHKGFEIFSDPTLSVEEAASRRDFTINAIYLDAITGETRDPFGGQADLASKTLRHVSEKFSEDPLRVLRGMQFVARFGLDPAPETVALCRTISPEGLPPERQFEEWTKLLVKGVAISRGLDFLRRTGWVGLYPELAALIGCEQDSHWHPEGDVWNHTLAALDAFARHRTGDRYEDLVVGLAVLCHDFGKPATTRFQNGHLRALGHDAAGEEPTRAFLARLTNEARIAKDVVPLVLCHMRPFALWKAHAGDSAVRKLAAKVGRIDRLLRVAHADDEGRPPFPPGGSSNGADLAWLGEAAERLRLADSAPKPILLGRHLLALGYAPSPLFHDWLDAAFAAQLDGKFADLAGALAYFNAHIAPSRKALP